MQLHVLGSSGSYPAPGRPASGYLIRHGDATIWLDAGPGTFAELQAVTDFVALDAVVLSHQHADHCIDLIGWYHAVRYGARPRRDVPVYAAAGVFDRLLAFMGSTSHPILETCRVTEVSGGDAVTVGDLRLGFANTEHPVPTVAVRFEADGRSLVYSADTGPGGGLPGLAAGADLLLCEATYQGEPAQAPAGLHLTASQAGELAARAEVGSLMLTHLWPTLDPDRSVAEAEVPYRGRVRLAVPGLATRV